MRRIKSAWLALASVAALTAAVGAARPHYGGTLRVEVSDASIARDRALPMIFETLTRIDPERGAQPFVAESWQADARGLHWRIRLRDGVTLHDGSVLTAWQVAAALRSVERDWAMSADRDWITIDLPAPALDLPWLLATANHAIVVRASDGSRIGTGPFRLEREDDAGLSLRAYEGYRLGRPFVDAVDVRSRPPAAQIEDVEAGRTDFVSIAATDSRRVEQRGLWVAASRPLNLLALVFEPHRAGDEYAPLRHALYASVSRDALASVLLQGRAVPALTMLPRWIPGYVPPQPKVASSDVAALAPNQRTLTVRVDATDPVARSVADRVAADVRERGLTLRVQTPSGLAPRADARIVTIRLGVAGPGRMLGSLLASRALGLPASAARGIEADLLDDAMVVPIAHVPDVYAVSDRVAVWNEPALRGTGEWNLASVWLRSVRP